MTKRTVYQKEQLLTYIEDKLKDLRVTKITFNIHELRKSLHQSYLQCTSAFKTLQQEGKIQILRKDYIKIKEKNKREIYYTVRLINN